MEFVSTSLPVNQSLIIELYPSKGIRKNGPLAILLFLGIIEGLVSLVRKTRSKSMLYKGKTKGKSS